MTLFDGSRVHARLNGSDFSAFAPRFGVFGSACARLATGDSAWLRRRSRPPSTSAHARLFMEPASVHGAAPSLQEVDRASAIIDRVDDGKAADPLTCTFRPAWACGARILPVCRRLKAPRHVAGNADAASSFPCG